MTIGYRTEHVHNILIITESSTGHGWSKLTLDITLGLCDKNHLLIRVPRWGLRGWWRRAFPILSISYPFTLCHSQFILLWSYIKGHENAASDSPTPHSGTTTGLDSTQKKLIQAPNTGNNKNFIVLTDHLLFIYFLMLEYFFNPYILSKEKKNWPGIWVSLCLTCEDFQVLPSWGFTAIYDNLQGNTLCCFSSNKLLWLWALTPSLIGKTEGTISREQSVIETPLCFQSRV